jgi:predicted DNA-binding transcriptional regulator YafY
MSTRLERVVALVKEINFRNYPTVAGLCDKFEIKPRTLHDDIRFIRDRLRIEIIFDKSKQGYYNSTPEVKLPEFDLSQDEVVALMLGKEMLLQHSGPVFRVQLEEALHKIAARLASNGEGTATGADKNIGEIVKFLPGGIASVDGRVMRDLQDACSRHQTVEIDYYAAHSGETTTRKVDPYRILEFEGAWYVAGWCHLRNELRKFALHRVRKHKLLKEKFTVKDGLNLDAWLQLPFRLEHGDGDQTVRIRFTPVGARFALDRQWHPTQKVTGHADGSCTMEFKAQNLDEVKRWVLPYGSGAEVIDPPELRRRVMEELRQALRGYGETLN